MVGFICILVLTKPSLINKSLIIDFLYHCFIFRHIKSILMSNFIRKSFKIKISIIFLFAFVFSFVNLYDLIQYFITLALTEGAYYKFKKTIL